MDEDQSPSFYAEDLICDRMELVDYKPISSSPAGLDEILAKELTSSGSFDFHQIRTTILDKLLEVLPLPVILVDSSRCIISMNMAGSGLAGAPFSSLFPFPDDARKADELLESVWAGRKPQTVEATAQIDQRRFWARMHLRSVRLRNRRLILVLVEDLTAEKTQSALTDKYRELVQIFPIGIAEFKFVREMHANESSTDPMRWIADARLVGGNREFAAIYGYSSIAEAIERPFRSFAPFLGECKDDIAAWIKMGLGRRQFHHAEETPDGKTRSFENSLVGNFKGHRAVGFWVTRRDTTEEECKKEALRTSEQRFRKIFEEGPLGIAMLSCDGRIEKANQTLCRMLGCAETEIVSRSMTEITHSADLERELDLIRRLENREVASYRYEKRLKKKNKRFVPVNITSFLIRGDDDQPIHAITMIEDITDHKKALERLNLLSAAVEQSAEGICITDLGGRVTFVNDAYAKLHQYSADELMGKHQSFFHPPADMLTLVAAKRRVVQAGGFNGEMRYLRRDGHIFPGLLHSALIRDDAGNPVAILNAVRDISEIKTTEQALRASSERLAQYSHSLETKVGERTKNLEESINQVKSYEERLRKADEALKVLIAGVEEQKRTVEKRIFGNVRATFKPILDRLRSEDPPERLREVIDLLDGALERIGSSQLQAVMEKSHLLTLRELRICEMINSGLVSKEIAKILGVSPHTIFLHRANIRRKLGLTGNEDDLASYLKTAFRKQNS